MDHITLQSRQAHSRCHILHQKAVSIQVHEHKEPWLWSWLTFSLRLYTVVPIHHNEKRGEIYPSSWFLESCSSFCITCKVRSWAGLFYTAKGWMLYFVTPTIHMHTRIPWFFFFFYKKVHWKCSISLSFQQASLFYSRGRHQEKNPAFRYSLDFHPKLVWVIKLLLRPSERCPCWSSLPVSALPDLKTYSV